MKTQTSTSYDVRALGQLLSKKREDKVYNVGIYCRLSRDDNNANSESMSISSQKNALTQYVHDQGWILKDIFIDDGISATTYNRPEFKRMIVEIEKGNINLVITKDLSRLGRNYVMTGQYTDYFFPEHGVRYVAVTDNYDSDFEDNDIAPFKNILNEMYAKDISKKIRFARNVSVREGKFMGSKPPYGYIKSPTNKHQLIIDDNVAHIVRRIFKEYVTGDSARNIGNILNNEGIESPNTYHFSSMGKINPYSDKPLSWSSGTIMSMLKNPVYIGNMVQNKQRVVSFKSDRRERNPEEMWAVVENTHEPLIDIDTWQKVQKRNIRNNSKPIRINSQLNVSLFSGIAKCADCGSAMAYNVKDNHGKPFYIYRCSHYANHGKSACSIHQTPFDTIYSAVLTDIQTYAKLAENNETALITKILNSNSCGHKKTIDLSKKKINDLKKRIAEIDRLVKSLFEEKSSGNIPDNFFKKMLLEYDATNRS